MPRKRKKKKAVPALTAEELRLLYYPPSPLTWRCPNTIEVVAFGKTINQPCQINSGSAESCWLCRTPRPESPILVWPAYIVACAKAGVVPDKRERWSPSLEAKAKEAKDAGPKSKRGRSAPKRAKATV